MADAGALLNELGADGSYLTIEDVFADMARDIPPLAGLNLSKIGDLGIELKWEHAADRPRSGIKGWTEGLTKPLAHSIKNMSFRTK